MTQPCSIPTDPEQKLDITCAICGKAISFTKSEVYRNWPSYVCKEHAAMDTKEKLDALSKELNLIEGFKDLDDLIEAYKGARQANKDLQDNWLTSLNHITEVRMERYKNSIAISDLKEMTLNEIIEKVQIRECAWKHNEQTGNYETSCGKLEYDHHRYQESTFCGYCGGKIV